MVTANSVTVTVANAMKVKSTQPVRPKIVVRPTAAMRNVISATRSMKNANATCVNKAPRPVVSSAVRSALVKTMVVMAASRMVSISTAAAKAINAVMPVANARCAVNATAK